MRHVPTHFGPTLAFHCLDSFSPTGLFSRRNWRRTTGHLPRTKWRSRIVPRANGKANAVFQLTIVETLGNCFAPSQIDFAYSLRESDRLRPPRSVGRGSAFSDVE